MSLTHSFSLPSSVVRFPVSRFTWLLRWGWQVLRWVGFAGGLTLSIWMAKAEWYMVRTANGDINFAVAAATEFPYDHRYRDLVPQTGIRLSQLNALSFENLEQVLEYAIAKDPTNLELWWNMAVVQNQLKNQKLAGIALLKAHQIAPRNPTVNHALGIEN